MQNITNKQFVGAGIFMPGSVLGEEADNKKQKEMEKEKKEQKEFEKEIEKEKNKEKESCILTVLFMFPIN